jgi:hypothetical protein
MYKILGEDKVMVDKLAPERLEAEYSLVSVGLWFFSLCFWW